MRDADLAPPDEPEGDEVLEWDDIDERERVQMCCDVIAGCGDFLDDALTDLSPAAVVTALRAMDYAALGRLLSDALVQGCKTEVEKRLASGDFLP
jgi:hypothetical protein